MRRGLKARAHESPDRGGELVPPNALIAAAGVSAREQVSLEPSVEHQGPVGEPELDRGVVDQALGVVVGQPAVAIDPVQAPLIAPDGLRHARRPLVGLAELLDLALKVVIAAPGEMEDLEQPARRVRADALGGDHMVPVGNLRVRPGTVRHLGLERRAVRVARLRLPHDQTLEETTGTVGSGEEVHARDADRCAFRQRGEDRLRRAQLPTTRTRRRRCGRPSPRADRWRPGAPCGSACGPGARPRRPRGSAAAPRLGRSARRISRVPSSDLWSVAMTASTP